MDRAITFNNKNSPAILLYETMTPGFSKLMNPGSTLVPNPRFRGPLDQGPGPLKLLKGVNTSKMLWTFQLKMGRGVDLLFANIVGWSQRIGGFLRLPFFIVMIR